jgi:CubicO group peptidase (beta-lactamase class C family)
MAITVVAAFFAGPALGQALEGTRASPLRPLAEAYRDAIGAPALAIGAISMDRVEVAAAGVRRLSAPAKVTAGDAFHTGSDAKAMFATAVAREVESGRLRWDTTVGQVFPELVATGARVYANVTIEDLLRHRSGLMPLDDPDSLAAVPAFGGTPTAQRAAFTAWALRRRPIVEPRTQALYSNAGYVVAAALLERVTRKPFESWMQNALYRPLGVTVSYDWPAAGCTRGAAPWGHEDVNGRLVPRAPNWARGRIPVWLRPAAGVSISTRDFAHFVQLHLRGLRGEARLLDATTFQYLHTPVDGFGLGWQVVEIEGRTISTHIGASGLFAAAMWIDAAQGAAGVAMTNADTETIQIGVQQIAAALAYGAGGTP